MFVETAMAVLFPGMPHNRVLHIAASCTLPPHNYNHSAFEMPWDRCQKYTGTPFTRRNKLVKNGIRASAEHLSSSQDPVKKNAKSSYHPFEEFAQPENIGDARPTAAETSRTITEVNSKATLMFSVLINDEDHENVVWPDLPYLTDECGNIYFQMKNGEDILQSLTSEDNIVQVIVGVDTMEMISEMDLSSPSDINFGIEEIGDEDGNDVDDDDEEDEYEDEDGSDDDDSEWVILSDEDDQDDDDETIADWAKLETMRSSHPMHFAETLAEIASDDPIDWMEQPPACLAIQGLIRPAFIEEHSIIQKHLSANQSSNTDNTSEPIESKGENLDVINDHVHNSGPLKDNAAQMEKNENSDIPINETAFYKLEMFKIQLFSAHGQPTVLEVDDYMKAQPDAIAHSATKIISRVKAGGEKTVQALKSLCLRCKAIQVEEAQLTCVDSLGFDVRVCSGTQVQTLRFAFKKRATSEYSAERQINDILFPGCHQKPQKMTQTQQNEC